jgi:hypothetical protein
MVGRRFSIAALLVAGACVPAPPGPPVPHAAMDVNASFGRTWDAVIDQFAAENIPIKTIDRSSGLIATDRLGVAASAAGGADCGKEWTGERVFATNGTYNALVRGDSTHSTLRVTVRWSRTGPSRGMDANKENVTEECSTKGTWETEFESKIKAAAEAKK